MKNVFKYIFISFGLLFLASFFVVDKAYAVEPCDCPCGCYYSGGHVTGCKGCSCSHCLTSPYCGYTRNADGSCRCTLCTCHNTCECGSPSAYPSCTCPTCPVDPPCPSVSFIEYCMSRGCTGAICGSCTGCSSGGDGTSGTVCSNVTCVTGITSCGSDEFCWCDTSRCEYGCESDGSCSVSSYKTPIQCEPLESCDDDKVYVYDSSIGACICVDNIDWDPEPSECDCTGDCTTAIASYSCPAGEHAGIIAATTGCYMLTCVDNGSVVDVGGDGSGDDDVCLDIDCDPTEYCDDNGWTTTPTPYLLEDVVSCTALINCQEVKRYGDCYEDPSVNNNPDDPATGTQNDIQTLKVTMGTTDSGWKQQTTNTSLLEKVKAFFKTLSMMMY